ncbi:serine hydrolase domain-containing protein [Archangium sp.]|uniref:serine hydrolase domain-containing protein n=1 Tax=Archangium sp. TaxID=1872627 RepID=UPI002D49D370|nr:serine hydrolase domain-containing protein [Archangium sp.]HYO59968.1 serine hydrolase domain-containing protein [Archangium sp.]
MKKVISIPALVLALAGSFSSQANANPDSRQHPTDLLAEKVDRLMAPWSQGDTPGAAIIVIQDGRIVLKKGHGLANLESKKPITPDTAFLLGSVTKQFTAMAVMMLAERGKLKYDDSLSKFFPEFPPYAQKITVRHLLHHTAGFPEYEDLFLESGKLDKDYPRSAKPPRSSFEPTSKDALAILAQVKAPRFAPGKQHEYSNSGYVILAQIVEKVSGQSFAQFLRQNIFQPLGMSRSLLYDETRPKVQNVATSYTLKDGVYRDIDYTPLNAIHGEDNIYSTVEDLYKWDQALYTERLVKAATLQAAFTPGKLNNGQATEYGFGWRVRKFLGLNAVGHGGSWLGFKTVILRFPEQHFTVVVLANLQQFDVGDIAFKISKIYLADRMTQ